MNVFFDLIAALMAFVYDIWNNYAWAITGLTLLVMVAVTPLTLKGTRSMMMMQQLMPEQKKLQNRYKDDRQKYNEELLKFYKENNISPLGGCLPLMVQMPIFIVLYAVLRGLTRRTSPLGFNLGFTGGQLGQGVHLTIPPTPVVPGQRAALRHAGGHPGRLLRPVLPAPLDLALPEPQPHQRDAGHGDEPGRERQHGGQPAASIHAIPYILLIARGRRHRLGPAEADPGSHPGRLSAAAATSADEDHAVLPAGDLDRAAGGPRPVLRRLQPLPGRTAVVHQPQHLRAGDRPRMPETKGKPTGGSASGGKVSRQAAPTADRRPAPRRRPDQARQPASKTPTQGTTSLGGTRRGARRTEPMARARAESGQTGAEGDEGRCQGLVLGHDQGDGLDATGQPGHAASGPQEQEGDLTLEWVETTGRTLDDAKDAALDQLGVDEQDAEFEVVDEPKSGLFGLTRREARVRARVRPTAPRPKVDRRDRRRKSTSGRSGRTVATAAAADAAPPRRVGRRPKRRRRGRRRRLGPIPAGRPAAPRTGHPSPGRPARRLHRWTPLPTNPAQQRTPR